MDTERTKFLKELMIFGGLWLNFSGYKFGQFLYLFQLFKFLYLIVGWVFIVNLIFIKGLKFLLTPTAVFIPLGADVIITSILLFQKIRKLENLIKISNYDLSTYQEHWERDIIEADTKNVIYLGNLFKYSISIFTVIYIVLPIIIDIIRAFLGYPEPYMVPLPLDGYFAEEKLRNLDFYFIVLLSDLWFVFGISNTIAFQCNLFFLVSYAATQIQVTREHIKRLVDERDQDVAVLPNWDLRYIIMRHHQIIRLNGLQRACVPLPYLIQGLISTLSFCFIMFLINQLFGNDHLVVCLALMFMVIMLGIMFIMCYVGNYLEEEGNKLFQAICDLPWHRQSPEKRRDLLIMVTQATRPLSLDYKRSYSLNLRTYMQMVNNAFSYFMLLKSLEQ